MQDLFSSDKEKSSAGAAEADRRGDRPPAEFLQLKADVARLAYGDQVQHLRPPKPFMMTGVTSGQAVQFEKPNVNATLRDLKSAWEIFEEPGMTLRELVNYANRQADWHASKDMDETEREEIRTLLAFARESSANIAGCGSMRLRDIRAERRVREIFEELRAYSRAVRQESPTVKLKPIANVAEAVTRGENLITLEESLSPVLLNHIMNEDALLDLISEDKVESFIRYVDECEPVLHAEEGKEVFSYLDLWREGVDPACYLTELPTVRNYHRFERRALDRLKENFGSTERDKPLTLILHTALDYNAAFHRDPNLTAVICNDEILALMIEGATSLGEVAAQLGPIAAAYGQNGWIDQVIIAGHGGARSIELAGTVEEKDGKLEVRDEGLDLDWNRKQTEAFFNQLLSHIGMDASQAPNRRVVFNACLTAANRVHATLDPTDPAKAGQQIRQAIESKPSIARFFQNLVDQPGVYITAMGANASTDEVGMIHPNTGKVDIISPDDPTVTSGNLDPSTDDPNVTSGKLDYVEFGIEPYGVMLAVVESYGHEAGPKACLDAMRRRADRPQETWDGTLIQTIFKIILKKYSDNAKMINEFRLPATVVSDLVEETKAKTKNKAVPKLHLALKRAGGTSVLKPMRNHYEWRDHVSVVGYQALMLLEDWYSSLLQVELMSNHDCRSVKDFIDIPYIASKLGELLPDSAATSPRKENLIIALLGVIHDLTSPSGHCAQFLCKVLGSAEKFPPKLGVETLLNGTATEEEILKAIGRGPKAVKREARPNANVGLERPGLNDLHVESLSRRGVTIPAVIDVRCRPGTSEEKIGSLQRGTPVIIIGRSESWYAIEYDRAPGRTAFIQNKHVRLE